MNPASRQAYLKAMGIDVWITRSGSSGRAETAVSPLQAVIGDVRAAMEPEICVGPGTGSTLLLCASAAEAATTIASDIARSLEGEPVWAWLASGDSTPVSSLQQAIEEHLFTRVLVFGLEPVARAAGGKMGIVGSAQLIWSDSIPSLLESGEARRRLWQQLCASHWFAGQAGTA